MATEQWAHSKDFSVQFQQSYTDLQSRLIPSSNVDELAIDIAKLSKSLVDSTGLLPSHDQRAYESQVNGLERRLQELKASVKPKSKFAFKRKTPALSSSSVPTSELSQTAPPPTQKEEEPALTKGKYVDATAFPDLSSDLLLSNLHSSVINLQNQSIHIHAVHVQNLRDTVLFLPDVKGSVLLHDLKRCTVVLGCHQFRMHSSEDVDVFIDITSNPIIEHCTRIRFQGKRNIEPQDFSHIKASPSPNWCYVTEERGWPELGGSVDVEEILESMLPPAMVE